jgi:opacity protein-like surface antigen
MLPFVIPPAFQASGTRSIEGFPMRRSKLSALARSITLIASVAAPCLAQAADLLPPLPPEPLPPPVEIGGGWYLRGDIGVGAASYDKVVTTLKNGSLPSSYEINQKNMGDQFFAGGGVGYQFNNFLRGDITGEYRGGSRFSFVEKFDLPYPNGVPAKGIDYDQGNLSSVVTMANGYIDLGTWYGVTPFIGGGIGAAFHSVSGFNDTGAGSAAGGFGIAPTKHTTSLAWAGMAGIGYNVTPNLKLEIGYRYLDLGHAGTGVVTCFNSSDCSGASYKLKDITSHDVRIGMRWLLGGVAAPIIAEYHPEPGPLVRKY